MTLPTHEVYALRYATVARRRSQNFITPPDPHDGPMPMDYFVWVIRNGARVYLVDTGFNAEAARARGWMVLASDASHYYDNMGRDAPFPIVDNVADMLAGYEILLKFAESPDHIVPGHDPQVRTRYPGLAGMDTEVVALHLGAVSNPR
ncbi:hypothetical protein [Achromobacter sp.]|uniref:hypothetical protein n=1 Tax=Achromobacter sp. TaxID=134375 RepID=UPI002F94CB44